MTDRIKPGTPGYSLRKAIDAKCKECIYDPHAQAGPWRMQVDACTSKTCPLHPYRTTSYQAEPAQ